VTDWFPDLEPPSGGLLALRGRLDRRRVPWWPVAVAVAVAVAVGIAVVWGRPRPALPVDAGLLAWVAPPAEAVSVPPGAAGTTAIVRVPGDVVWYRVGGTTEIE
jgi:hypothetical protein